jgi:hypothetical protein
MTRYLTAAVVAVVLLCSAVSAAQWGGRVCDTVVSFELASPPAPRIAYPLCWHKDRSAPGQWDLMRGGHMVGAYDGAVYRMLVDYARGEWSEPTNPPVPAPVVCRCKSDPDAKCICDGCQCQEPLIANFGIDLDNVPQNEGYKIGGEPVTQSQALDAVTKGLPDDANKVRVTVIGTDEDRKRFLDAFHAAPDLVESCVVGSVPPDHFWLKDLDTGAAVFKNDGHPTIYVQKPDGTVLWRQDDDRNAVQNLRRVVAPYDPNRDPGPNSPAAPFNLPAPLVVGGAFVAIAYLFGRKTDHA